MALHIVEESERCLECKRPGCQKGCPVGTPIPQVIALFKERRIEEAGRLLFENNPLSLACSLVCNHGVQCEGGCVLSRKGNPVQFSSIETYVSDSYLGRLRPEPPAPNGKKVALIGSGPAGITAAFELAKAGCAVTVFEQRPEIGGVMRYGIPAFRLPKIIVDRYRVALEGYGVQIRPTPPSASRCSSATCSETATTPCSSARAPGAPRPWAFPEKPAATCTSASTTSSAPVPMASERTWRSSVWATPPWMWPARPFRHGARRVTLYARSKHVSASSDEVEYAQLDGAQIVYGKAIAQINDEGPLFRTAVFDENDQVVGYEDDLDQVRCDTVIIAASQKPMSKLIATTDGLRGDERGLLVVDDQGQATVPGVFAAGDVVTGPKTVVHTVAATKCAVQSMLRYMGL